MQLGGDTRKIVSWALYDWANSAYATTVMAGFFPLFFKQYWSGNTDVTASSFELGAANSIASLIIVLLAPLLGSIADRSGARKAFLMFFAAMGVVMTGGLYLVAHGNWLLAISLYIAATIGFMGGNIFYDALILNVARRDRLDVVSALGFSFGYLGGGILFALNVLMVLHPEMFGFSDSSQAVKVSFLTVAIWWAVFSVPLFLFVKEPHTEKPVKGMAAISAGFSQLLDTLREIRRLRVVMLFLLGYWLYIDGVDTIVRMAVDYGMALGFDSNSLIVALLITQFVGFPAAILFGKLGERLGTKTGIYIALAVYLGVTVWGYFLQHEVEFYMMAIAIGLVQGGVQSLSRSLYARIIPPSKVAEFFGFYNMLGKFAAVIGPVMMGWVSMASGNPRLSILSIALLFIIGGALLFFVDERKGHQAAMAFDQ